MITVSIARRYARALIDVGQAGSNLEAFGSALDTLSSAFKGSPELRSVMENPAISTANRQAILSKLLEAASAPVPVGNLLKLLVDRNRTEYLEAIARAFRDMVDQLTNRVRAKLTSAVALDAAAVETIRANLAQATAKQVTLEKVVDPKILGGVIAQVGSLTFDGSLSSQLEELRRQLRS